MNNHTNMYVSSLEKQVERLKIQVETLETPMKNYADPRKWRRQNNSENTICPKDDIEEFHQYNRVGGKWARKSLSRLGDLRNG